MAPKNKKKNGFFFFMKDVQQEMMDKGTRVSMSTLPNLAHPRWKNLSLAEREVYEELAKKYNHDPNLRGGKMASDGKSLELYQQELEEEDKQENILKQDIKLYVNADGDTPFEDYKNSESRKVFYFISFNLLCKTEKEYIPNEIGLVEYSIQHGIHREYHKILNPGRIPTGYTGEAKRFCEKHKIDIFGAEGSERDMRVIVKEIKTFIDFEKLEDYPPLVTKEEDRQQTIGCLKWLSRKTGDETHFRIWPAKYLLMELRHGIGHTFPSAIVAENFLNKTCFNFFPESRCIFHEEEDVEFCALAYSKCLCYLFSDALCELFDVKLTEKHMPARSVEEKLYSVTTFENHSSQRNGRSPRADFNNQQDYHQPKMYNSPVQQYSAPPSVQPTVAASNPVRYARQPASSCVASEMMRLSLNMTAVPGHGIGRGKRQQ